MVKGYWIVRVEVTDPEQYQKYLAVNLAALTSHGARFIVRAGRFKAPEGESRSRNIVIEFPSYQAACDCWHSPQYAAARSVRHGAALADLVIIEGYDGPQP
ncbi:MAG TPA: DUF1330 domain-containing protein [Steroidobacteraceae bacterium]